MSDNPEVKQIRPDKPWPAPPPREPMKLGMRRKDIRNALRRKAREVHFQDKLLAEWMNQLADKI